LGALDWAADSLDLSDEELNRLLEDVPAPEALAGDDFGEAWVPGDEGSQDTATATTASTAAASDALRAREQALANARTEEERSAIMRDRAVYRVTLSFANEQAAVVRDVLGDSPAEKLLALCEAEAARLAS
jgi:hypothetical protein